MKKDVNNPFRYYYLLILALIILLGGFLRFVYLDRVPTGISDDELNYVLTAKSVYFTGKTLDGTLSPFSFFSTPYDPQLSSARVPYMLMSPFIGFLKTGLGSSKIPYGVISILTTIILFLIAMRLWGTRIALFVAFVSSVNPWSIYFGRTAFEAPISVFFAYVFLFCLLYLNNWWLILSCIPWIIGFYSYQGINIIYLPILLIGVIGIWKLRQKKYSRQYFTLTLIGIVVFSLFVFAITKGTGNRLSELSSPNNPSIISQVNIDRRTSVQTSFNPVFINKFTTSAWDIAGKYISAFSSTDLFVSGEGRSTFSLWTHGLFYPIDFVLLLIGLYGAYRLNKRKTIFLLCLVVIAPIPAALSVVGASYALRASFMYPLFCMFIGMGIALIFEKSQKYYIKIGITLLYLIVIANFLHIYFIRNPVNNSEGFGFSNRLLAKYMQIAANSRAHVFFIGNDVINPFRQYIFYNDLLDRNSVKSIQASIHHRVFVIGDISFIECPQDAPEAIDSSIVITPYGKTCPSISAFKKSRTPLEISQLNDSGRLYEIFNDSVCSQYELPEYQHPITFDDLQVEKMTTEQFCKTYVSKPKVI